MKPPKPRRIQLSRAKGWRTPASAVKVDRTTPFGNPFSIEDWGHDRAVALHRAWLTGGAIDAPLPAAGLKRLGAQRAQVLEALPGLRGQGPRLLVRPAAGGQAGHLPRRPAPVSWPTA